MNYINLLRITTIDDIMIVSNCNRDFIFCGKCENATPVEIIGII